MTGLVDPTQTKRKYANIKNFLDGPTLIQRTDAHEVEVVDEDRGKKKTKKKIFSENLKFH